MMPRSCARSASADVAVRLARRLAASANTACISMADAFLMHRTLDSRVIDAIIDMV
jgi:hypothetical protein